MIYNIPNDVREAARHAGKDARKKFLADNPEPREIDFECRWCGANSGEKCRIRKGSNTHKPRQDKYARAFNDRQFNAVQAEDDAFNRYIENWEKTRVCCDHSESCSHVWCDECGSWSKDIGGMVVWSDDAPDFWFSLPKGAAVFDCTHPRDYHKSACRSFGDPLPDWCRNIETHNKETD